LGSEILQWFLVYAPEWRTLYTTIVPNVRPNVNIYLLFCMYFRVLIVVKLGYLIGKSKRRYLMYANLKLHEVEKLRKLEKELGVVLIAYREETRVNKRFK
jgi:hypothetical protein